MTLNVDDEKLDLDRYRVVSRKEIITILRQVARRNQLVRMDANGGADSAVTAILGIDEEWDSVIIDCASTASINQRLQDSANIRFESVLDNIRILFSAPHIESCDYEGHPALRIDLPEHIVRLQRREHYRVFTPATKPVRCTIHMQEEGNDARTTAIGSLYNVSGGGISITDEKKLVPPEVGRVYQSCQIDIPGSPVVVTLQLMNCQDLTLSNGKQIRRLGFMFVDPSNATLTTIQRYITKIEREQNARATGMG